jgi:hypothetical protein
MAHINPIMRIHTAAPVAPTVVRRSDARSTSTTGGTTLTPTPTSTTPPAASSAGGTGDPAADFRRLFTANSNPPVPATPQPVVQVAAMAPTAQSLFGPHPWMDSPGGVGPNGVTYSYNPYYFATADTAAKVAEMVGGTVVKSDWMTPSGPFQQNQPNYMIQFANGHQLNAGLVASIFDHGYTQDMVNKMMAAEMSEKTA